MPRSMKSGEPSTSRGRAALYTTPGAPSPFAYQEMCNYYLNYDFSIVLTLMLCLYGIIGTFVSEREPQMDIFAKYVGNLQRDL